MSPKNNIFSSLHRIIVWAVFIAASLLWARADALAQGASPAAQKVAADYLFDRYSARARQEAWNSSAVVSANSAVKFRNAELLALALPQSDDRLRGFTDIRPDQPPTRRNSPELARFRTYSLLTYDSAAESFLYGRHDNDLRLTQWLADKESVSHEVVESPRALFELNFGSWQLPVVFSGNSR